MLKLCCQEKHKTLCWEVWFFSCYMRPLWKVSNWSICHIITWRAGSQDWLTRKLQSELSSVIVFQNIEQACWCQLLLYFAVHLCKVAKTGYSLYVRWKDELPGQYVCIPGASQYFKTRADSGCQNLSSGWPINFIKFCCIFKSSCFNWGTQPLYPIFFKILI